MSKGHWALMPAIVVLGFFCPLSAYKKFCYATYQYPRSAEGVMAPVDQVMRERVPFGPAQSDYMFEYDGGAMRCFVKLRAKDRRKIRFHLAGRDPQLQVTPELIASFREVHRGKDVVVGWVLEDFVRRQEGIRIGDVLAALGMM